MTLSRGRARIVEGSLQVDYNDLSQNPKVSFGRKSKTLTIILALSCPHVFNIGISTVLILILSIAGSECVYIISITLLRSTR